MKKKKVLMSLILLAIIGTSAVFAQTPTLEKLRFGNSGDSRSVRAVNTLISGAVVIPATHEGMPVSNVSNTGFENITGITSVTMLNGMSIIGQSAFRGCTGLTSVTIPGSVTTINQDAFNGCTSLTTVTLLTGLTSIGGRAFAGCTRLTSITLPAGMTLISNNAFDGCTNLTSVTFQGAPPISRNLYANAFPGDLRDKYIAGGAGVYTRTAGSNTWTRTGNAPAPVVNTSLNGVWGRSGSWQATINGNTGVYSSLTSSDVSFLDAVSKNYIKLGDQAFRNITTTGNLTWSGQYLTITTNTARPNVAIGTAWENCTFTMSADGQTLTVTGTAGSGTLTRR